MAAGRDGDVVTTYHWSVLRVNFEGAVIAECFGTGGWPWQDGALLSHATAHSKWRVLSVASAPDGYYTVLVDLPMQLHWPHDTGT